MTAFTLDHVIIGVEDLAASADKFARVLGGRPSWRGRHPSYGTANVLFRLQSSYIELLAPDPEAATDSAWTGSLGRFLRDRGGGLFSIALQTSDIAAAAAEVRARGLPVEEPLPGTGVDVATGAVRQWVNARIPPEATRGTRCFLIQHVSPPSALPPALPEGDQRAVVLDTVAVVASSSDAEGARRMWREVFRLPEEPAGDAMWRFDLGNATLLLQKGQSERALGEPPDCWEALVLMTLDLDAAAARLRSSGIETSAGTLGPVSGLWVEVCGARLLLTEAE